ncbi:response regulator [Nannocystis punicea]|uniref:Response regulator n=1 Tax=Nannocystis punicea TaxID=2995304 RepID=A0ABY7GV14_9BACT|nr:response regulator [Nannocystis poenicansa]WAS90809.1 response regulator [Nannocystis poenicansa]
MTGDILVVDDDESIREVMEMILADKGYRVRVAADGAEALQQLRDGAAPDVILLDLMMPGMDGWTFHDALIHDPTLARIPVVAMSGDGRIQHKAASMGVTTHLAKPIDLDDLLRLVARFTESPAAD